MFLLVLLFSCTALSYTRPLTRWIGQTTTKALPEQMEYG